MVKPSLAVPADPRHCGPCRQAAWMLICGRLQPSGARKPQGGRAAPAERTIPSSLPAHVCGSQPLLTGLPIYGHWQRYKFKFNNPLESLNDSGLS